MKRNLKFIIPFLILVLSLFSFDQITKNTEEKDKVLINLLKYVLTNGHYSPQQLNDQFSETVFNSFIENLDPSRRYFLQSDIEEFSKFKFEIDDELNNEELVFFNLVHSRFIERLNDTKTYYPEILAIANDFSIDEELNLDHKDAPYAESKDELKENWRKQLKFSTLSRVYDKVSEKEEAAKKNNETYTIHTTDPEFIQFEKEAREASQKFYDDFFNRMEDLDHEDWFGTYLNNITAAFDPHTSYFPPRTKKQFDEDISGKLEGIGARLMQKNDYTKVTELISGGPAWRAGELEAGDIILKVAQGDEEPLDIVGMRLSHAIEFIKGKKGTEVRLTLKKIDGTIEVISIIRDIVEIEETFVKSSIIDKDGKRFGVINLPKFYIDFSDKEGRNCADDMALEIENLKIEGVDGIMIDLRNNGGGSLPSVVEMAGLFIEDGPIVQVKYKNDKPIVQKDRNKSILWNGPLVVLTNELSASASEIFAAAMQDYKRAIIIGSKQTFGKGTVQSVLDLNRYSNYSGDLGGLNMTIQKFYRINGGSTQLEGIKPDIVLPSRFTYMNVGEKDYDNPLPWDQIKKANYDLWDNYSNFDKVVNNSIERINENSTFLLIDENAKWLKKGRDDNTVYLEFDQYSTDLKKHNKESKKFKELSKYETNLTFRSPKYELPMIALDSLLGQKRTAWHKNLAKDIYIEEGLNVLGELKIKQEVHLVKK